MQYSLAKICNYRYYAHLVAVAGVLSSVGRASPLQGECQRFDPVSTHQKTSENDTNVTEHVCIKEW